MWHVEDQSTISNEYPLSIELSARLDQASLVLEADKQEIVAQALREFLDKHGIHAVAAEA